MRAELQHELDELIYVFTMKVLAIIQRDVAEVIDTELTGLRGREIGIARRALSLATQRLGPRAENAIIELLRATPGLSLGNISKSLATSVDEIGSVLETMLRRGAVLLETTDSGPTFSIPKGKTKSKTGHKRSK